MDISEYRTLFVSDVHLGTVDCHSRFLLDLLDTSRAKKIYLIGDILDFLKNPRLLFSAEHNLVVQKLFELADAGVQIIYIPGNHDAIMRRYCGKSLGQIEVKRYGIHQTADGRRFMVSHGDEFDAALNAGPMLYFLGNFSHAVLMRLNTYFNALRQRLQLPFWSIAATMKRRIGSAKRFIERFEHIATQQAKHMGLDGYIGGHIHHPDIKWVNGVLYLNDGDFVEHCTLIGEDHNGRLSLLHWSDVKEVILTEPPRPDEAEALPSGTQPVFPAI